MEGFEWAENNLGAREPHELQSWGVNVYFAPNIEPETRVVNLEDGRVDIFWPDQERPQRGYYANLETLERYCYRRGTPLNEIEGMMTVQPVGGGEAGDPLRHEGR